MARRWCCRAPGSPPSRPRWPVSRSGWDSSAKSGSACSTACAGASGPCPASSTRTPRWRCRMAPRCRRNGRCRNCGFRLRISAAGGRPTAWDVNPAVALAPGSVGASKRWTYYAEAARLLAAARAGCLGGRRPRRKGACGGNRGRRRTGVRDLTGTDLRNGILAMAAAGVAISNDSGLMHIAAAIGTPTMGIFGPTSPYLWAPLNGLAATVQTKTPPPCEPCQRTICTMNDHACMRSIPASDVVAIAERVLADGSARWPLTSLLHLSCVPWARSVRQSHE